MGERRDDSGLDIKKLWVLSSLTHFRLESLCGKTFLNFLCNPGFLMVITRWPPQLLRTNLQEGLCSVLAIIF